VYAQVLLTVCYVHWTGSTLEI